MGKKSSISISSDFLGEKGESRFKEICADAGIICNKSDRDRAGWDFILDFDFEQEAKISLDRRIGPVSCHVQVKTILSTTKSVRLKLNMAERLAKEIKPSFVYVMKVDENLKVVKTFLIHMYGDRLASILKRLRTESVNNNNKINDLFISITPSKPEELKGDGQSLLSSLKSICGGNRDEYSSEKKKQLSSLGNQGLSIEIGLTAKNNHEMSDILLGLKRNVSVSSFRVFDRRFDLDILSFSSDVGSVSFSPRPQHDCRFIIKESGSVSPIVVDAKCFILPYPMVEMYPRACIRSSLFQIDLISRKEKLDCNFSFLASSGVASACQWRDFWRVRRAAVLDTPANLKIDDGKGLVLMEMNFFDLPNRGQYKKFSDFIELCEALIFIEKICGNSNLLELTWASMKSQADSIITMKRIMDGTALDHEFNVDGDEISNDFFGQDVIFCSNFLIEKNQYAYYSICSMLYLKDKGVAKFSKISPGASCILKTTFEDFVFDARFLTGIDRVICLV